MPEKSFKKNILTVLIVLTLAFIWGNSLVPAEESSQMSSWATKYLYGPLNMIFGSFVTVDEHFVRKLAHFSEYTVLGMEMLARFWSVRSAALFGLAAAVIDEGLQSLSDRSPQLSDVLLDFTGVLFGMALLMAVIKVTKQSAIRRNELQ